MYRRDDISSDTFFEAISSPVEMQVDIRALLQMPLHIPAYMQHQSGYGLPCARGSAQ
jgi:hypothetical protein